MKILLAGYYGFGNLGDDILMMVTYGIIKEKYPNAEIYIFSNYTTNLSQYHQIENYNHYIFNLFGKDVQLIDWTYKGHFDLILHGGGGVFFDYTKGEWPYYLVNKIGKILGANWLKNLEYLVRRIVGKPSNLTFKKRLGIGIGIDFFDPLSPQFIRKMSELGSFDYIAVRDEYSFKMLKEYGFKGKSEKISDLAFLTTHWSQLNTKREKKYSKTIGITLMDWKDKNEIRFRNAKGIAQKLTNRGYHVKFFSFDENHDKQYINEFINEDLLVWKPNQMKLDFFLDKISECDIMICSRAHAAILGACLGVLPICLDISIKLKEVSKMIYGENKSVISINDLSTIENQISYVEKNYLDLHSEKRNAIEKNQKLMKEWFSNFSI